MWLTWVQQKPLIIIVIVIVIVTVTVTVTVIMIMIKIKIIISYVNNFCPFIVYAGAAKIFLQNSKRCVHAHA
jgi:hypothetical protein